LRYKTRVPKTFKKTSFRGLNEQKKLSRAKFLSQISAIFV